MCTAFFGPIFAPCETTVPQVIRRTCIKEHDTSEVIERDQRKQQQTSSGHTDCWTLSSINALLSTSSFMGNQTLMRSTSAQHAPCCSQVSFFHRKHTHTCARKEQHSSIGSYSTHNTSKPRHEDTQASKAAKPTCSCSRTQTPSPVRRQPRCSRSSSPCT